MIEVDIRRWFTVMTRNFGNEKMISWLMTTIAAPKLSTETQSKCARFWYFSNNSGRDKRWRSLSFQKRSGRCSWNSARMIRCWLMKHRRRLKSENCTSHLPRWSHWRLSNAASTFCHQSQRKMKLIQHKIPMPFRSRHEIYFRYQIALMNFTRNKDLKT